MREIIVTEPLFVSSFRCTGSACRDHCCKSWSISIDKKTVKKYTTSKNIQIKNIAHENIQLVKKNSQDWGVINFSPETGSCPYLDQDRLCLVQKNLGKEALSHTCSTFPRSNRTYKNEVHHSLTISCPEVVSILLNNPDAMGMTEKVNLQNDFNSAQPIQPKAKLLNLFCLSLMNAADASIEESLYAVIKFVMFIQKYDEITDSALTDIESAYLLLVAQLEDGTISRELGSLQVDYRVKTSLLLLLQDYFAKLETSRGTHVLNYYSDFLRLAISSNEDSPLENKVREIESRWVGVIQDDLTNQRFAFKNYILYKFWHNNFPNHSQRSMLQSLYLIIAEYYYIKIVSASYALGKGNIDTGHITNIIYSFHSISQHNQNVAENFYRHIETVRLGDDLSMIHLLA